MLNFDQRGGPDYISMSGKLSFLSTVGRIGIFVKSNSRSIFFCSILFYFSIFLFMCDYLILLIIKFGIIKSPFGFHLPAFSVFGHCSGHFQICTLDYIWQAVLWLQVLGNFCFLDRNFC